MSWSFRYGAKHQVRDSEQYANGWLGLLRACQTFDPARGCQFSTYASWWIRQAITRPRQMALNTQKAGFGASLHQPVFSELGSKEHDDVFDPTLSNEPDPAEFAANKEENADNRRQIEDCLRVLDKRTAHLIRLHIMEDVTLEECGKILDPPVTKERVRQLVEKGLNKIRAYVDQSPILLKTKIEEPS